LDQTKLLTEGIPFGRSNPTSRSISKVPGFLDEV